VSLRRNKLLLFLVEAVIFVILIAVAWTYISPAYNHLLLGTVDKIAPSDVTLELQQSTIYFYHDTPYGTDSANIPSWALQFGLVIVIALIAATPGLRLTQRLKFIVLAFMLLFVIHIAAVWIAAGLLARRVIFGENALFNFLVTLGCDLFPVVIWGVISLRYWFPKEAAMPSRLPRGRSHRKVRRSR
jgi:hypothetical protein